MSDSPAPSRYMRVVDRRADPPGRSAVNRERFIRRFKDEIKRAVDDEIGKRGIADVGKGSKVSIPGRGLKEPYLHHDPKTGSRDFVLPGNHEYIPGDTIARPDGGEGGGQGREPGEGESRDDFGFVLSRDEFLQLFFDDLELPNLERTRIGDVTYIHTRRAGYSKDGVLANLSPVLTMRMSIARRIALRGGIARQIAGWRRNSRHWTRSRPSDAPRSRMTSRNCAHAAGSFRSWKRSTAASVPASQWPCPRRVQ